MASATAIETALKAWVAGASGVTAIWAEQNGPRPAAPFITMKCEIRRIGHDWVNRVYTPSYTAYARGVREGTLRLQSFSDTPIGTGGARALLEAVMNKMVLPSYFEALRAAGIGVAAFSPIQQVGAGLNAAVFEPRALMDVRFFLASEVSETTGSGTYIEFVEIENEMEDHESTTYVPEDPT